MNALLTVLTTIALGLPVFAASSEKVSKETGEAVDAAAEYAKENKEEFARKMRANLASIEADIAGLKNRAGAAAGDARDKLNKQIADLEKKRDEMKKRLDKFSASGDRAWKSLKGGIERAWSEVKVAYDKASKEFEEEEAAKKEKSREQE